MHEGGNAGVKCARLGDDAQKTAEHHDKDADAHGSLEALNRSSEHIRQGGALNSFDSHCPHDDGDDGEAHQYAQNDGE